MIIYSEYHEIEKRRRERIRELKKELERIRKEIKKEEEGMRYEDLVRKEKEIQQKIEDEKKYLHRHSWMKDVIQSMFTFSYEIYTCPCGAKMIKHRKRVVYIK